MTRRRLVIIDANILIDMEVSGLVEQVFRLEYEFAVPDILYEEEITPYTSDFKGTELNAIEFDDDINKFLFEKQEQYKDTALSRNDISALVLAIKKDCILLTGETALRQTAENEGVDVHGTLWLVEELFNNNLIDIDEIEIVYEKMKKSGSRLPWDEVERQVRRFRRS